MAVVVFSIAWLVSRRSRKLYGELDEFDMTRDASESIKEVLVRMARSRTLEAARVGTVPAFSGAVSEALTQPCAPSGGQPSSRGRSRIYFQAY
ncbi:hypothetical protein [Enhygromyxa salina]|uniref:hypothetical protein n=1 Tax=Enhygromyxa salina TaxID=215803 RepID=UPI000D0932F1|nr:hypothetical protein [Enhygromyxa salina]